MTIEPAMWAGSLDTSVNGASPPKIATLSPRGDDFDSKQGGGDRIPSPVQTSSQNDPPNSMDGLRIQLKRMELDFVAKLSQVTQQLSQIKSA